MPDVVVAPTTKPFWDPAEGEMQPQAFSNARKKLEERYAVYQAHPRRPLRNLLLFCLPIVFVFALLYFYPPSLKILEAGDGDGIWFLILPFLPPIAYAHRLRKLQRDLVKMMIAREHGWLYSPDENHNRWGRMVTRFSEFFQKGDEGQNLQDEFWGDFQGEKQTVPFYSGVFEYVIVTRGRRGRKHRSTYYKTVVAVKLNKTLKTDFRLEPEGMLTGFFNFFRKKEIDTESAEFNKAFAVFYQGEKVDKELEIVKVLSPAIQVKLLELKKSEGSFALLFRNDVVLFTWGGMLLQKMHTNFFKKVALDERDKEDLNRKLKAILEISSEMVPFLD